MSSPITVLIAASGQPALLARTLAALAACERPSGYGGVVVVENGPRCGIEDVVRAVPADARARYLYVPEANKSHALNVALAEVEDGLAVFTDDDSRADSHLLVAYARGSAGASGGEFYGGPLIPEFEREPPGWMRGLLPNHMLGWQLSADGRKSLQNRTFIGPNWAAFRRDLLAIGGFEPRLGPGGVTGGSGQDTDAQQRLRAGGIKGYYLPDAKVGHLLREEYLDRDWILKRAYRQGLGWGIRQGRSRRWSTLRLAIAWARRAHAHAAAGLLRLRGGSERQLIADFTQMRWRGRWEGIAVGRRWDEIPYPRPPWEADNIRQRDL